MNAEPGKQNRLDPSDTDCHITMECPDSGQYLMQKSVPPIAVIAGR